MFDFILKNQIKTNRTSELVCFGLIFYFFCWAQSLPPRRMFEFPPIYNALYAKSLQIMSSYKLLIF